MRGADASAGTIKSGGKTRRAAKMVILDADHPDVEEFIWCKVKEERKARVLRDNGFDMDLDGSDSFSIQYQNANNSVRVTDEFMQAVAEDADWALVAVKTGEVLRTVKARDLWRQIAQAAWECADPGLQFDTTINRWHTAATTGRINGSNPCSEYVHLDNSACNLASINLLKYLDSDGNFDVDAFRHTVEIVFTAQEILVGRADYPTPQIGETTRNFRQLGLGYANLGALLMALGLPYDSADGRAWAAAITSLMTGHAYATSAPAPPAGWARSPGSPTTRSTCCACCACTATPASRWTKPAQCRAELSRRRRSRGMQPCATARSTACATRRPVSWRRPAAWSADHSSCTDRGLVRLRSLGDPDGAAVAGLDRRRVHRRRPADGRRSSTSTASSQVVDVRTARGYRIRGTTEAPHQGRRRVTARGCGAASPTCVRAIVSRWRSATWSAARTRSRSRRSRRSWRGRVSITSSCPTSCHHELAELVGYFMGDGSLHAVGLRLCVTTR